MEDKGSNGFGSCNVIQEFPPQLLRFVGGIFVGLIVLGAGRLDFLPDFHACCEEETKTGIHHQIPPSSR